MATKEEVLEEMNKFRSKIQEEKFARHFKKWNKTMQYHFTDTNEHYYIKLVDGIPEDVVEGQAEKPEISYSMSTDLFMQIQRGEISGLKAYNSGKLKVKASMSDLIKLQKLN